MNQNKNVGLIHGSMCFFHGFGFGSCGYGYGLKFVWVVDERTARFMVAIEADKRQKHIIILGEPRRM